MWCSYYNKTSHNHADCRVQQYKAGGNAHLAAARTQCVKEVCSAYNLPERDDEPEHPYVSYTATEVQGKTEPETAPRQKNGTWPFDPLIAARPWLFMEREKPAISLGGQDEPDLSYMYVGTNGEREPLYGTALMAPGPVAFKHKPSAGDDSVNVLVNSGASGHYFDDLIIPSLKYCLLNYVLLTTPRKIFTAGGALLDGTAEGILQRLVTDNHGEHHLAWITILIVPGIERNIFSVKSATKKGIVSIFDFDNPRMELSGITITLWAEDDDLYSLVFDLSADNLGGKELAMYAMINAQLWHRQPGYLNKRILELMQRRDGNGVTFDDSINHCDVCVVGKSHQLAHPKKAKHADIMVPFQLVHGDLTDPFKPTARESYEYVSKITDQLTKWTAVYLLCTIDQALASLQLSSLQPSFRSAAVSSLGEPIRVVNTPAKTSKRIARRRTSPSSLRPLTCHNKSAFRNALDGHCARWPGACVLTAGYRHFFGGSS